MSGHEFGPSSVSRNYGAGVAALIESGRVVDLILLVLVAEGAVLAALSLKRQAKLPLPGLLLNLVAAGCLVLGLRAVFSDAGWVLAGVWLGGALLAHVGELALRLGYCYDTRRDNPYDNRRPPGPGPQNKA